MSKLVHNERLKLRPTFFSNLGIAAFIACFVTPGFFEFASSFSRASVYPRSTRLAWSRRTR